MIKILSLIVVIGLAAAKNEKSDFIFTINVLKQLLSTETELMETLLEYIGHQQKQLHSLSNVEFYSLELKEVSRNANHHIFTTKSTVDMLNGLVNLWHQMDENCKDETANKIGFDNVTSSIPLSTIDYDDHIYAVFDDHAQRLCAGMIPLSTSVEKQLKCRFIDHGNPFLKIAPFKQEDVYLEPHIVIYHNVITDEEIETLQELAYPKLAAAIVSSQIGPHVSKIRVSETAYFHEEDHQYVTSINRRAEHMTNLYVGTAEVLQVAHYKPGGYFNEHFDFDQNKDNPFPHLNVGNRIGTLMFYLNDVQEGGKTVFSDINVTLTPKKGNAVFWYDLFPSGDLDYDTAHAGCHVVSGEKWVANIWFHEHGQEFRRPCTLESFINFNESDNDEN